ncbi:MAG: DUF5060 domain-containing protein [Bryobacteraceae bacterium]
MRHAGLFFAALFTLLAPLAGAAPLPSCTAGVPEFSPCQMTFEWHPGELPPQAAPVYRADIVSVEFRSPEHVTYLMHGFWNGGREIRVRFTPLESGTWTYHVRSTIHRLDNQESTFNVSESGAAGFVRVANLRHWRSTNKQPHLWLSAEVNFLGLGQSAFDAWLDARKQDGFNHVRGVLLTLGAAQKPLTAEGEPNLPYFAALDDRILAADKRGFTLDLVLADRSFLRSGAFSTADRRDWLVRYLIARYGGLNVTWQGIEHFEDVPGSRALLKDVGSLLKDYGGFDHPRSTSARLTSSSLIHDGWMNYAIEAYPKPELGAVERQFIHMPEIHVISATAPDAFRHELWDSTMNGEDPEVPYAATENGANMRAVRIWVKVLSSTRYWELDPYFDVDGARALGLGDVEYLAYSDGPGIVEVTTPKHKYNPFWVNPITGEEIPLKNYKGEVLSRQTPDGAHDWILNVPRDGLMRSMLSRVYFESRDPTVQVIETDTTKIPFRIASPSGKQIDPAIPIRFEAKIMHPKRSTRIMQYVWWGEAVASGVPARVLGVGPSGTFTVPKEFVTSGGDLEIRLLAINANGKVYEVDRVYGMAE